MTYHDDDLARLAANIESNPSAAKIIHRIGVDAGVLTIVQVYGDRIDTHVLIRSNAATHALLSLAVFSYVEFDVDAAYHTGETINGVPYIYSAACGGHVDSGVEHIDGAAAVVFTATAEAGDDR